MIVGSFYVSISSQQNFPCYYVYQSFHERRLAATRNNGSLSRTRVIRTKFPIRRWR
jgi:hypothetical protein